MMRATRTFTAMAALLTFTTLGFTGCATLENLNNKERGAVIGAAGGAAVGGVVGNQVGSTAAGAIIGAVVGGAAGAVIGHQMDQQAEELANEVEGADVSRVGEGIVMTFESGLLFPYDSAELMPAARENLRNLAESLSEYPETEVLIVGHTDSTGSDSYNQGLSERRAASAASFLASMGVPRVRISTAGRGETEPVASNESEAGRQQNRRVEVAIYASEEYRREVLQNNPGN